MNIQKPTLVHVIAWMTLASGITNLFWGIVASGTALATIVGIFCTPLTILPTILGVFELIYAAKLFSDPPQAVRPSTNIAVLEIASVITLNMFSMAVGILALVFYNDAIVKDYFIHLNGVLPSAPTSPVDPKPVPAIEPPSQSAEEPPLEETPVKPKRGPRKVAK